MTQATIQEPPVERQRPPRRQGARRVGEGLVLGVCLGLLMGTFQLDHLTFLESYFIPFFGACGCVVALTPMRNWLWFANGFFILVLAVVGYTPLTSVLIHGIERSDPLAPAPAVVVLSDYLLANGVMSSGGRDRLLHGFEVLQSGNAPVLVLTRAKAAGQAWDEQVKSEMASLGLDFPVVQVGSVASTHDEALAVAELVREKGWRQVILVTHSWHMRRAAAVFEKAGVKVICSPCADHSFDSAHIESTDDRIQGFNRWSHEALGYVMYRWRGWI